MITEEQAKQAAGEGVRPSLVNSRDKWLWWAGLSYEQYRDVIHNGLESNNTADCAVCQRMSKNCTDCILGLLRGFGFYGCCEEVGNAAEARNNFKDDSSLANYNAFIKAAQSVADRIQREIDKMDEQTKCKCKDSKPALRHGDYGIADSTPVVICQMQNKEFELISKDENGANCGACSSTQHYTRKFNNLGNIFDDLKPYSEDLEEFHIHNQGGNTLQATFRNQFGMYSNGIEFNIEGTVSTASLDQAEEIAKKLLQMVYTAKRKL